MSALLKVTNEGEVLVEAWLITASQITLAHLPDPRQPITIPGYTQTNTPIPLANQFFVNYASGVISFNAINSGTVNVTYSSIGENVDAKYINQLIDAIAALQAAPTGASYVGGGLSFFTAHTSQPGHQYDLVLFDIPKGILSCVLMPQDIGAHNAKMVIFTDPFNFPNATDPTIGGFVAGTLVGTYHPQQSGNPNTTLSIVDVGGAGLADGVQYLAVVQYLK